MRSLLEVCGVLFLLQLAACGTLWALVEAARKLRERRHRRNEERAMELVVREAERVLRVESMR